MREKVTSTRMPVVAKITIDITMTMTQTLRIDVLLLTQPPTPIHQGQSELWVRKSQSNKCEVDLLEPTDLQDPKKMDLNLLTKQQQQQQQQQRHRNNGVHRL